MSVVGPRGAAPASFQVVAKPGGPFCNLLCAYCYYRSRAEGRSADACRMSDEVLETLIRRQIEAQRVPEVAFAWQGGEPTRLGLDFFRRVVALQEMHRPPGVRVTNAIQTNGTLLDREWARFLRKHRFLVGISLDGPEAMHDAWRVDAAGRGSHARVMAGLRTLQRSRIDPNVLVAVHAANVGHPLEVYRFLRDEAGARFLQFIPIVERLDGAGEGTGADRPARESWAAGDAPAGDPAVTTRSVTGEAWGEFLVAVLDEWLHRDVGRVSVQLFDAALAVTLGRPPGLCTLEETCGRNPAVEHDGTLYACDHYVDARHRLGNLRDAPLASFLASEPMRRFGRAKRDALPRACRACDVLRFCRGGCPRHRFGRTADGEPGLDWLCAGWRRFFRRARVPMARLAEVVRGAPSPPPRPPA